MVLADKALLRHVRHYSSGLQLRDFGKHILNQFLKRGSGKYGLSYQLKAGQVFLVNHKFGWIVPWTSFYHRLRVL